MKNSVGKGAFVLIISGIICKFFGGLFRLPLTNIIGIEGIGLFQMIMSIYSLALVFVSGGVTNSLAQLISSARARGDEKKIGSYVRYAIVFSLSVSLALGVFFLVFSNQISSFQGASSGAGIYKLFIILLPLGGVIGTARGIVQGYENMVPTSLSQIIEQVTKFAFGLLFAYLLGDSGHDRGVFGAFLGIIVSEVIACVYLAFVSKGGRYDYGKAGRKEFFSASLPLTFASAIIPLAHAVESLTIVKLLSYSGLSEEVATTVYGLQTGVVGAILNFPLIISISLAMALLPNIAYLSGRGEVESQRQMIKNSFSCMWYILIPLVFGIASISGQLYPLIYSKNIQNYLPLAVNLTLLGSVSIITTAIMQFLLSLLQANGKFAYSMKISLLGAGAKLVILFLLAPSKDFGIYALPLSNIFLALTVCIFALVKLGGLVRIPFFDIILPLLSAFIMYLVVRIFLMYVGGVIGLLLSILLGMAIYFTMSLPLTCKYFAYLTSKVKKGI